jgi:hypothetical protein
MKVEQIIEELRTSVLNPELFLKEPLVYRRQDDFEPNRPNGLALAFPGGIECRIWTDAGRYMSVRFRDWNGGGASLRTHTALILLMRVLKEQEESLEPPRHERKPERVLNQENISKFLSKPRAIMMLGVQTHTYEKKFAISSLGNGDVTFGIREEWGTGITYAENQTVMNTMILLAFAMQEDNTKPRL